MQCLGDALSGHQLVLHRLAQTERIQHLGRCQAVGGGLRVGDRQVVVLVGLEHRVAAVQIIRLGRP